MVKIVLLWFNTRSDLQNDLRNWMHTQMKPVAELLFFLIFSRLALILYYIPLWQFPRIIKDYPDGDLVNLKLKDKISDRKPNISEDGNTQFILIIFKACFWLKCRQLLIVTNRTPFSSLLSTLIIIWLKYVLTNTIKR